MKQSDINVGAVYRAKISGKLVDVRVESIRVSPVYGTVSYGVLNLSTGRRVSFRSSRRFRSLVSQGATMPQVKKQTRKSSPSLLSAVSQAASKPQASSSGSGGGAGESNLSQLLSKMSPEDVANLRALLGVSSGGEAFDPSQPTIKVERYKTKSGAEYPAIMVWGAGVDPGKRKADLFLKASQFDLIFEAFGDPGVVDQVRESIESIKLEIKADK